MSSRSEAATAAARKPGPAGTLAATGIIIEGPGHVVARRLSPPLPGTDHAVIAVERCGLCTPEQRVFRGARATYPYWGGHELSGRIVSVAGDASPDLRPGRRVAVALMHRCGTCWHCCRGLDNHCAYLHRAPGDALPAGPRGLSDRIAVPLYQVVPVDPDMPAANAALVEPVACALRSVSRAGVVGGVTVMVIGAGTMGLIHLALLRRAGCRVVMVDDDEQALATAQAAGAEQVATLTALSRDSGVDPDAPIVAAVCTRGGAEGIAAALSHVARGGRVVLYQSIAGDDAVTLSANLIHYRELQIIGTVAQSIADFRAAAALLAAAPGLVSALTIESYPIAEAGQAFHRAIDSTVHRAQIAFTANA